MRMIITPVYSDIFEGEKPTLEFLLNDIPSEVIIAILCVINAKLYSGKHTVETQVELFDFLTSRQTDELKFKIINNVFKRVERNNNEPIKFFASIFCMEFIHFELLNYRDFEIEDTTPQQELNFLKAYFLIVERTNTDYYKSYEENNKLEGDYFRKNIWPTLINQIEANNNISYIPGMIKAIALFNFLEYHSPYSQCVKDFLKAHDKKTSWNYVVDLLNLIKTSWDNYKQEKPLFFPLSFKKVKGYETLFELFTLKVNEYKNQYSLDKKNFTGLKEKPLFFGTSTKHC